MPSSMMSGISSGRVALGFVLVLVFVVVAFIVEVPGPGTRIAPTGQTTVGPTTTTHTTISTTASGTASTRTTQTTLPSNLIPAGGISGSVGGPYGSKGPYEGLSLNSSTYAEVVWNATGAIDLYLYNSTGGFAFSRTGQESGNYTFCVPMTGSYTVHFNDADVSYNAPIVQVNVNVYEIQGSVCTPSP